MPFINITTCPEPKRHRRSQILNFDTLPNQYVSVAAKLSGHFSSPIRPYCLALFSCASIFFFARIAHASDNIASARDIQWSSNGQFLAWQTISGTFRVRDNSKNIIRRFRSTVDCFAWAQSGHRLAVGITNADGRHFVRVLDGQTLNSLAGWQLNYAATEIKWRPDHRDQITAIETNNRLELLQMGRREGTLKLPNITAFDWSPHGQYLALGSATLPYLYLWDSKSKKTTFPDVRTHGPAQRISFVRWSPDGSRIALSRKFSGVFEVRSAKTFGVLETQNLKCEWLWKLEWSSDGKRLFTSDSNGLALIWTGRTLNVSRKLPSPRFSAIALHPNGKKFAIGDGFGNIFIYNVDGGRLIKRIFSVPPDEGRLIP